MTVPLQDHQFNTMQLGWEMIQFVTRLRTKGYDINLRIGINCGPVYGKLFYLFCFYLYIFEVYLIVF
jgi:hypothetical protein